VFNLHTASSLSVYIVHFFLRFKIEMNKLRTIIRADDGRK